jgi:hypothetical protein
LKETAATRVRSRAKNDVDRVREQNFRQPDALRFSESSPSQGFAMPRQLIEPHPGDKRYVRRKQGKFTKSQDEVGRSLSADRRKRAKKVAKKGEGDRGDRRRGKVKRKTKKSVLSRLFGG